MDDTLVPHRANLMAMKPEPMPDGSPRRGMTSEDRRIFLVQLLLLFLVSTVLYVGFPGTREWRARAEEQQMRVIIRGWDSLAWFAWPAMAPLMLVLIRRNPLTRDKLKRSLFRLVAGSIVLYLLITHLRYFLRMLPEIWLSSFWNKLTDTDAYLYNTFSQIPMDFLTYCGFFAASFSIDYYYKNRSAAERSVALKLRTARLESDLARAELAALRGQLHPHFLFNSFNALTTLVRLNKNEQAVEIIAQLSELLRLAIERTGLHEIPLHQELDFIRRYLDIERLRYGEKLQVEFKIEPAAQDALVPNIVLQPLVENAIKHAISLRTNPGWVRVEGRRSGARLQILIKDDGPENPPPPRTPPRRPGIGLANSRAQLEKLYGNDYRMDIVKRSDGGTTIQLDLPWRLVPVPETHHEKNPSTGSG